MSAVDLLASAIVTLVVHATVLLGAVWFAERAGALKHRGWAELAWRAALLGALVTTSVHVVRWWPEPEARGAALEVAPTEAIATMDRIAPVAPMTSAASGPATNASADAAASARALDTGRFASSTASAPSLELRGTAALALLGGWMLALLIGATRFGRQAWALGRLARHSRRHGTPAPEPLHRDAEQTAAAFAVAPPSLQLLDGVGSPLLLPGRRLLLPAWVPSLSVPQRRALLAHELAHLQRRDPAWRVLQRLAALPLCFHPLVWHALARLDALAEDDCDARAADLAGSGRPLAECLAACLAHAARPAPVLAVAMADRPGPVVRRVRNLLENASMSDRPVSPLLRRSAIVLGLAAALVIPGVVVSTVAARAVEGGWSGHLSIDGRESIRYSSEDGDDRVVLDMEGEITFNDAESDVVRLGPGASLELEVEKDGVEREIRIFGKDGAIQREYRVDGDVVPLDAAGRAWLAQQLPEIIRETGIRAEERGKRFLAHGGPDALMAEIAKIRSDFARGRYLAVLFGHAILDDAQTGRALEIAKQISSHFELRQALQTASGTRGFPKSKLPVLMEAALGIDSDFELAELLTSVAEQHPLDASLLPSWRKALAAIGSDFERRRVLDALVDRGARTPGLIVVALESANGIGSDFERRQVLDSAAPHIRGDAAAQEAWFAALAGIGSDFETRSALQTVIDAGPVDVAFADRVLAAVGGMGSDFEIREVLTTLAERMPDDAALRDRYRASARGLGDFERGQAEKALDRFAEA